jgi:hypothetical protein
VEEAMKVTGRCHCGRIEYEAVVDPERVTLCHCTDCQMLTGSAYRVMVPAPRETFALRGSPPKTYVKTAESGTKRLHAFCPECGTPVYSCAVVDPPAYSLRIGCLEQRVALRPKRQMWSRSALGWSGSLEDVESFDRQ